MNRYVGIALLIIGVFLLVVGFNASESFASEVKEFFTNSPTERSIWFIIGGIAAALIGLGMLAKSPRTA
jgi:hypothetical protein